ncbi:DUF5695 domain-containing protein [Microbacterium sp. GXF0217]
MTPDSAAASEPSCYAAPTKTTNAAVAATPSASYTASWNNIKAVNDGVVVYSGGSSAEVWGTYSSTRPAQQWLQYDWTTARTLVSVDMSFWYDNAAANATTGVAVPASWTLESWDAASSSWKPLELAAGSSYGTTKDATNSLSFARPVTTTKLRATFSASGDGTTYAAIGVSEFAAKVSDADAFVPLQAEASLVSDAFNVGISTASGGLYTLQNNSDPLCTNYTMNPAIHPAFDINDSRWTGDIVTRVNGVPRTTGLSDDIRTIEQVDADRVQVAYRGSAANANGVRGFDLTETYELTGESRDVLDWRIRFDNTSATAMELEDLGIPLLMNSWWDGGNQTGIYEQNVARHSFVAGDGSYIYWQRPNGEGPYLVMVPDEGTSLEFKDKARPGEGPFAEKDPSWEGLVEYYLHSSSIAPTRVEANKAAQYLPATSATIAAGDSKEYGFTFRWADDYADLRDVLYEAGVVDAVSLPGMTIPSDTTATLAVRAKDSIDGVVGGGGTGAAGQDAVITAAGSKNGYELYDVKFPSRGENYITVQYGDGRRSVMQYNSIAPVEELIDASAEFVSTKQQSKDTARGYDGAYLQWDMRTKQQVTRQNISTIGLTSIDEFNKRWMTGGSDDVGLSPAAFLAEKNAISPNADQIASLDYYIDQFLLGYLQNQWKDGQRTWNLYHWYDGGDGDRPSTGKDDGSGDVGDGLATWRVMNSPHVWNTYLAMYRVASAHPELTERSAAEYLDFAFNTARAYFQHSDAGKWLPNASREMASMGELSLPIMRDALVAVGRTADAEQLSGFMSAKYDEYAERAYPFASEMSIDTTAFESVYALSKEHGDDALARKTTMASLAARGLQPLWYYYGGDNRHMGESWWNLGYETQLGAWQQQDYLMNYDAAVAGIDPDDAMRSTYGAYLAGWSNINTGQISSDPANYGAASWQFQSEKGASEYSFIPTLNGWWAWSGEASLGFWGGLQTAAVNVVDDAIVGPYAYGGDLEQRDGSYVVTPRDGVRQRANFLNLGKFGFALDGVRYTTAEVTEDLSRIAITVEASGSTAHGELSLGRLPAGDYSISVDGATVQTLTATGADVAVALPELTDGEHEVVIALAQPDFGASATATTRCIAGKAVVVATVTNGDAASASFTVDSVYGSKTVELRTQASSSTTFASRAASIPAGEVTVDVTGRIDGADASQSLTVGYTTRSCG